MNVLDLLWWYYFTMVFCEGVVALAICTFIGVIIYKTWRIERRKWNDPDWF